MLAFPRPQSWFFTQQKPHDFACICQVCLKVWAVCGSGESGFNVIRSACLDCAYSPPAWTFLGPPGWWRVEGSLLTELEGWMNEKLTRKRSAVADILDILPPNIVRHEFLCHLKGFEWFNTGADDESEDQGEG